MGSSLVGGDGRPRTRRYSLRACSLNCTTTAHLLAIFNATGIQTSSLLAAPKQSADPSSYEPQSG